MTADAFLEIGAESVASLLSRIGDEEGRVRINPETVEQDLARLVLGLIAFLRKLMELQAIRQMDQGLLSLEQEEALGMTLMRSESALHDMAKKFGLSPNDLSLDLGPLGKTI